MEALINNVEQFLQPFSHTESEPGIIDSKGLCLLSQMIDFLKNVNDNECLGSQLQSFIAENVVDSAASHRYFVVIGVLALNIFIQANWTGPLVNIDEIGPFAELFNSNLEKKALDFLESDGDEVYQLIKYPILLLVAHMILVRCYKKFALYTLLPFLSVKCLSIYLHVIDEVKESHLADFQLIFDDVESDENEVKQTVLRGVLAEYYMICFHLSLKCYKYPNARQCLDEVKRILQIEVSLTSALGKRTKFQEKEYAQLKVLVTKTNEDENAVVETNSDCNGHQDFPVDILLDNDTLLPHIKFADEDTISLSSKLSPAEHACIVCECVYTQLTAPKDKLICEQMVAYVEGVLAAPKSWSTQLKALFLRCSTEMLSSRKMERALLQLESIVQTINKPDPPFLNRLYYAQAVDLHPQWENERTHGRAAFAIGYTDTALEVFLRLKLWDEVISCYQRLGRHGKAEEVIREQLEVRESVTLWCLLGDVTLDKQYYEKAWDFSNHRNARAQRSLGLLHLRKQEFKEAIPYFQKSLELNCLQPGIAFSLGCSCMAIEDVPGATKALQLCVSLEPENPQAWNNLASNYIRLNQIEKAYKALKEASRQSFENWRIWENYLLVATDLGHFEDTINICHRLIELNRKSIDIEVLRILTKAVLEDIPNARGTKSSYLKPKLFKLFGHITSSITSDPNIWEVYADLCLKEEEDWTRWEQGLQNLYKSFRSYNQNTSWENNEKEVKTVMRVANKTVETTKVVCTQLNKQALTFSTTTKMLLSNLLSCLEKAFRDENNQVLPSIEPYVSQLGEHIAEIETLVESFS